MFVPFRAYYTGPIETAHGPILSDTDDSDVFRSAYMVRNKAKPATGAQKHTGKGIQVVRFHVWQDFTAEDGDGAAPLHATVTVEMADELYEKFSKPSATIRIDRSNGEGSVEAKLMLNQAHYGLGLAQPGSRQLQFVMWPTPMYVRLHGNEVVRGVVRLGFQERTVSVDLPETRVIFTR